MTTDYRALCAELLSRLEESDDYILKEEGTIALADRARAALAQPEREVVGPTDEELLGVAVQTIEPYDEIRLDEYEPENNCAIEVYGSELIAFARAVLARWGHQPAPPAEGDCPACEGVPKPGNQPCAVCGRSASSAGGEVAELAWWLRSLEDASVWFESGSPEALKLTRAADLLEQRHPVPVPVAERLPGPEDCLGRPTEESDAGWCWTYSDVPETWSFESVVFPRPYPDPPLVRLKPSVTHWLPHYALPLPQGEVQP